MEASVNIKPRPPLVSFLPTVEKSSFSTTPTSTQVEVPSLTSELTKQRDEFRCLIDNSTEFSWGIIDFFTQTMQTSVHSTMARVCRSRSEPSSLCLLSIGMPRRWKEKHGGRQIPLWRMVGICMLTLAHQSNSLAIHLWALEVQTLL